MQNLSISGRYGGSLYYNVTSGSQDISNLYLTGGGDRINMLAQAV